MREVLKNKSSFQPQQQQNMDMILKNSDLMTKTEGKVSSDGKDSIGFSEKTNKALEMTKSGKRKSLD